MIPVCIWVEEWQDNVRGEGFWKQCKLTIFLPMCIHEALPRLAWSQSMCTHRHVSGWEQNDTETCMHTSIDIKLALAVFSESCNSAWAAVNKHIAIAIVLQPKCKPWHMYHLKCSTNVSDRISRWVWSSCCTLSQPCAGSNLNWPCSSASLWRSISSTVQLYSALHIWTLRERRHEQSTDNFGCPNHVDNRSAASSQAPQTVWCCSTHHLIGDTHYYCSSHSLLIGCWDEDELLQLRYCSKEYDCCKLAPEIYTWYSSRVGLRALGSSCFTVKGVY